MTGKPARQRADELLVNLGLADSRSRAKTLIMMGKVYDGERRIDKAGDLVREDAALTVREDIPFVSRGGLKLQGALDGFRIDVAGMVAADIGASTGGFTDCLLQRGASHVYAIDVGHGLLDSRLANDPRVTNIERTNIRHLDTASLAGTCDIVVTDVSFISLTLVLPKMLELMKPSGVLIALIKPQFELTPREIGKGGIVRDEAARQRAVDKVTTFMRETGLRIDGLMPSPIHGQKGNVEFLVCGRRGEP